MTDPNSIVIATEIVTAWLANPHTRAGAEETGALLASVHSAAQGLVTAAAPVAAAESEAPAVPAVSAKASMKIVGRLISMIDGKPYASLTRHLTAQGLTPDEYRRRFNLPTTYPMVAPAYSEARSAMAKKLGLGRKPKPVEPAAPAKPTKRKSVSEAKKAAKAHLAGA